MKSKTRTQSGQVNKFHCPILMILTLSLLTVPIPKLQFGKNKKTNSTKVKYCSNITFHDQSLLQYRLFLLLPISIIPVFERIVYDQLYNHITVNNLLSSHQSAFRSLRSIVTALLEATYSWSLNIDRGLVINLTRWTTMFYYQNYNSMVLMDPRINGFLLI